MNNKLKILCLHGYFQNASRFSNQIGSLRKMLKHEADFFFLSAPHKIEGYDTGDNEEFLRSWWFSKPNSFNSRDETDVAKGLDESLENIKGFFTTSGPFHGILGFSQGAALTGLLCAMKQANEIDLDFNFVIIVAGFKSKCRLHEKYFQQKIKINSFHVIGEADQVITKEMSYELADMFENPMFMLHPGGHFVPGKSSLKSNYLDFLLAQTKS